MQVSAVTNATVSFIFMVLSTALGRSQSSERRRVDAADPLLPSIADERLFERVELHVRDRHEQQRQEETQRLAADDRHRDGRAAGTADPDAERRWNEAGDDR